MQADLKVRLYVQKEKGGPLGTAFFVFAWNAL